MDIEKFTSKACCGKTSIVYKLDRPMDKKLSDKIIELGFKELSHFTKVGIIYLESTEFILICPIGSNKLQVKYRRVNSNITTLENLLKSIK